MDQKWGCKACGWKGYENKLAYKKAEGCVGEDKTEVCPDCGSERVFMLFE